MFLIRFISRYSFVYNLYITFLIALFSASVIIEKGKDVLMINGNYSTFLDQFFRHITAIGDGTIFILIVAITLFIRFQYSVIATLAWISHGIIVSICKRVMFAGTPRPRNFLDNDLLHFVPGVNVHGTNSFPSGHTATAFCAAFFIALISKNKMVGLVALIVALLVGYSRIYLLQHFLMDVAAGAIIGCFTTHAVWQIINTNQRPWMNRKLKLNFKSKIRTKAV